MKNLFINFMDKAIEYKENTYEKEFVDELEIKYKINGKKVKLFNIVFVKINKDKCYIVYENKEYPLQEEFNDIKTNKKILEIKLKGIKNIEDTSNMF